ncbi:MAG TPA: fumarylacetoacetate hydrolase family protein [Saprospiraceae bacterium]|nr:fumarylacetoacetate hydrolase family protein [Saprospiraceae bacterium]MCB9328930.1 fumarylacetoacetate hydrolase family protein [Lewinellaceae bacterium]HPK08752.1 fumarylacetoacetate hydrolase family protein [Saprospiraceae bacterium]HPQ20226.1 fumarylacetoacetate hydrolase family protein [Saprospiraceae bacterium]HRX28152.1 fumarylacetoacetate hydrolase family protein [Saprospiraceae bacterium]
MKIFCIGRNYVAHAAELNNKVPDNPIIFMKPPTALLKNNDDFYHPDFSNNIHYECELVVKIKKSGKAVDPEFAHLYYDEIGLGIDFTARDLQEELKSKGLPWEIAKGFDNSAVISTFLPIDQLPSPIEFSLYKNGDIVQKGTSENMIFNIDSLIVNISKYFTLQQGDLIYTGTPAGVGKVEIGDILEGFVRDEKMFSCRVR